MGKSELDDICQLMQHSSAIIWQNIWQLFCSTHHTIQTSHQQTFSCSKIEDNFERVLFLNYKQNWGNAGRDDL